MSRHVKGTHSGGWERRGEERREMWEMCDFGLRAGCALSARAHRFGGSNVHMTPCGQPHAQRALDRGGPRHQVASFAVLRVARGGHCH